MLRKRLSWLILSTYILSHLQCHINDLSHVPVHTDMSFSTAQTGSLGRGICCKLKKSASTVLLFPLQLNPQWVSGNGGHTRWPVTPLRFQSPFHPNLSTGSGDCPGLLDLCVRGQLIPSAPHLPLDHPILLEDSLPCTCQDCYYSLPTQDSWSSVHF